MCNQRFGDDGSIFATTLQNIQYSFRQAYIRKNLNDQVMSFGTELGGLEDNGTPGRKHGRDASDCQNKCRIPTASKSIKSFTVNESTVSQLTVQSKGKAQLAP